MPRGASARRLGHNWERQLRRRIEGVDGWSSLRVGAPSPQMPDIMAWSPGRGRALVAECKATSTKKPRVVRREQVDTLLRWASGPLSPWKDTHMIIACRWTAGRAPVERFAIVQGDHTVDEEVRVHIDGRVGGITDSRGGGELMAHGWEGLRALLEVGFTWNHITYRGRPPAASPATGGRHTAGRSRSGDARGSLRCGDASPPKTARGGAR